jgi:hypothetical protein
MISAMAATPIIERRHRRELDESDACLAIHAGMRSGTSANVERLFASPKIRVCPNVLAGS